MSRSPGDTPPLRKSASGDGAVPRIAKPTWSSAPVVVWPPPTVMPSGSRGARPPPGGDALGSEGGARARHHLEELLLRAGGVGLRHLDRGQGPARRGPLRP